MRKDIENKISQVLSTLERYAIDVDKISYTVVKKLRLVEIVVTRFSLGSTSLDELRSVRRFGVSTDNNHICLDFIF